MKRTTLLLATVFFVSMSSGCSLWPWSCDPEAAPVAQADLAVEPAPQPAVDVQPVAVQSKDSSKGTLKSQKNKPTTKKTSKEPMETAKMKLDLFAKQHVARANTALRPNRSNKDVTQAGGQYVAKFSEVDAVTLKTEIYESSAVGAQYVGHVVYIENIFECAGKTKQEALSGNFKQTKSRRIRELTRFDKGQWHY